MLFVMFLSNIDFILEYKEPLVNRERKVKELFKTSMMILRKKREEEEEEIEDYEDDLSADVEDDEKKLSGAKQKTRN